MRALTDERPRNVATLDAAFRLASMHAHAPQPRRLLPPQVRAHHLAQQHAVLPAQQRVPATLKRFQHHVHKTAVNCFLLLHLISFFLFFLVFFVLAAAVLVLLVYLAVAARCGSGSKEDVVAHVGGTAVEERETADGDGLAAHARGGVAHDGRKLRAERAPHAGHVARPQRRAQRAVGRAVAVAVVVGADAAAADIVVVGVAGVARLQQLAHDLERRAVHREVRRVVAQALLAEEQHVARNGAERAARPVVVEPAPHPHQLQKRQQRPVLQCCTVLSPLLLLLFLLLLLVLCCCCSGNAAGACDVVEEGADEEGVAGHGGVLGEGGDADGGGAADDGLWVAEERDEGGLDARGLGGREVEREGAEDGADAARDGLEERLVARARKVLQQRDERVDVAPRARRAQTAADVRKLLERGLDAAQARQERHAPHQHLHQLEAQKLAVRRRAQPDQPRDRLVRHHPHVRVAVPVRTVQRVQHRTQQPGVLRHRPVFCEFVGVVKSPSSSFFVCFPVSLMV